MLERPLAFFSKHRKNKDGLDTNCKQCKSIKAAKNYIANKAKIRANVSAYTAENKAKIKIAKAKYQSNNAAKIAIQKAKYAEANPGKMRAYHAAWYIENSTDERAKQAAYQKLNRPKMNVANAKYSRAHPDIRNAMAAKRRAAKFRATPAWADTNKIRAIYSRSAALTKTTGNVHHVDHIVPLQSDVVCGLHCEANLQVLLGTENTRKHNRHWPDMPT
jgi:hypothetical protein